MQLLIYYTTYSEKFHIQVSLEKEAPFVSK